jgi:predicted ferric reductase
MQRRKHALSEFCNVQSNRSTQALGISLNLIACAFMTVWIVEYLGYNAGTKVHILLAIAVVLIVARLLLLLRLSKRA